MQAEEILKDIVDRLEQATRIQQNITNTVVRQSTLIARLNERLNILEEKEKRLRRLNERLLILEDRAEGPDFEKDLNGFTETPKEVLEGLIK